MKKMITFLIASTLAGSVLATDKGKDNLFLSLQLNDNKKINYIKDSEKEKETYDSPSGYELRYLREVKQFAFGNLDLGLYYHSSTQGGVTAKDQDMSYGGGPAVRMVKTETSFNDQDYGIISTLSFQMPLFKSQLQFRPYLGLALGIGNSKTTQEIMTDKKKPTFFSTHNRSTLTTNKDFYNYNLILGSAVEFGKWSVMLEASYKKAFATKIKNSGLQINEEGLAFNESDYKYASPNITTSALQLGLGYSF